MWLCGTARMVYQSKSTCRMWTVCHRMTSFCFAAAVIFNPLNATGVKMHQVLMLTENIGIERFNFQMIKESMKFCCNVIWTAGIQITLTAGKSILYYSWWYTRHVIVFVLSCRELNMCALWTPHKTSIQIKMGYKFHCVLNQWLTRWEFSWFITLNCHN